MNSTPRKNAAVLISGNGSNLQAIIDQVETGKLAINLVCVISNKSQADGLVKASRHNIDQFTIVEKPGESRETYDQRLIEQLDECQAELILLAGFMRILSTAFVEKYKGRLLNIHPALLPKYKGLNTHQRVLDAGDSVHGASVHFVTPELDGGPSIMQARIPVLPGDNKETLKHRLLTQEHLLYPAVIKLYAEDRVQLNGDRVFIDHSPLAEPLTLDQ